MHSQSISNWQHEHTFGQDQIKSGERKTLAVIVITGLMMLWEISTGILSGSMALLADGIHMGSHAAALGISVFAYLFARKRAADASFSFGTGKVNSLAGYTSAILLAVFALTMAWESLKRLMFPVEIAFDQALWVAVIGLVVNSLSVWILNEDPQARFHSHEESSQSHSHADHNLRSAYLHVLADAVTSLTAIFALVGGKFLGWTFLDPLMGIVGAALVARWSWILIRNTSRVLLDQRAPLQLRKQVTEAIESRDGNRITDFHLWEIGPRIYAAAFTIVTSHPKAPEDYKRIVPDDLGIVHTTVEVHCCNE